MHQAPVDASLFAHQPVHALLDLPGRLLTRQLLRPPFADRTTDLQFKVPGRPSLEVSTAPQSLQVRVDTSPALFYQLRGRLPLGEGIEEQLEVPLYLSDQSATPGRLWAREWLTHPGRIGAGGLLDNQGPVQDHVDSRSLP